MQTVQSFAADMKEMIQAWDRLRDAAKAKFPGASEEEIFNIAAGAMNQSLGLKPPVVKPAPPAADPRIYSALKFKPTADGGVTYEQIEVAATTQAQAIDLMRLDGVTGTIFVLTDEAVRRSGPCKITNGRERWDTPTLEEHERWVRIQTRGHWDSGRYDGPTYTRIYLGPIAKVTEASHPPAN